MGEILHIKNFGPIKDVKLELKKINIFIGEHNSGKSNILEALTWFSPDSLAEGHFKQLFRFKNVGDFFYDFDQKLIIMPQL